MRHCFPEATGVACIYAYCYALCMLQPNLQIRVAWVAEICRERHISQSQIAEAVGASQSQVSRILSGNSQRPSRLLEDVCLYVERQVEGVSADAVRRSDELIEAVRSTWDGSAAHARALSTVIRSLAILRSACDARDHRPPETSE